MNVTGIINHIVKWLDDYLDQSGLSGFVVGVSGGIDSAVTSTLCARTGQPVQVLSLPIFQQPVQLSLAQKHLTWLAENYDNTTIQTIDLTPAFTSFSAGLPPETGDDLALANSRSRLRMMALYAVASHHKLLVTGTGNKVEDFGVGFYTKYGDGGVDLSPLADLVKTEVYQLGRSLGIITEIMQAPPTDGLWGDDRTDESQLGATYKELEWAMNFEEQATADEIALSERQTLALEIYRRLHRANRHKMTPIPVCEIPEKLKL